MNMGLSKSSLGTFKNCARCFWLEKNMKIKRPRGITASIMDGIDEMMKSSVEGAIERGIPHAYLANIPGAQPFSDRVRMVKFRKWQTFQATVDGIKIWGELDDLIEFPHLGLVQPWDYKSNGSERDWAQYIQDYYTLDGDMYHLILEKGQGLKCTGKSTLTFQWPAGHDENGIQFAFQTVEVATDPQRAIDMMKAAVKCLTGPMPDPGVSRYGMCEYCVHYAQLRNYHQAVEESMKAEAAAAK